MDPTRTRVAIAVVLLLACAGSWWALSKAGRPEPVLVAVPPPPPAKSSNPRPVLEPSPEPAVQHTYHLPRTRPARADFAPTRESLELEEIHSFQRAGMKAAGHAKRECLMPWAEQTGEPVEVVMDAVLNDGIVVDVRLRTLNELPPEVLDCMSDHVWGVEWPMVDGSGEMNFQRVISVGVDP